MLEKMGLPARPSKRGNTWVVDASHCQGCASQFTFINRKHHCRRCGGLFCNTCTQQRMILRGQGDSPVRICDPCKKLEDAARFELRNRNKGHVTKGSSKEVSKNEEEVLNQILGTDGKQRMLIESELHGDMVSNLLATSSSGSIICEESSSSANKVHVGVLNDFGSTSPEELRQRAVDEKKKYKILKGEGKSEEALQAFKRGKDLERQAAALEITLRKNRRMASKAPSLSATTDSKKTDDLEEPRNKKRSTSQRGSDDKNDLSSELRELGWSDVDLHDADKKPAKLSLEGELANLLGEIPQKSSQGQGKGSIDKAKVIAHKRQALVFKREGKLAEAKEELKKAKILEKQIEEQELLGEDEESDDELSALINSMDDEKHDDLLLEPAHNPGINFDRLLGVSDDLAFDGDFEVTDDDMNDPDLAAALKSFGWTEEDDEHEDNYVVESASLDREALTNQVLTLKREALSQKRVGNVSEAMTLLKKAKLLEKDLEEVQRNTQTLLSDSTKKSAAPQVSGESSVSRENNEASYPKISAKSKLALQRELLGIKKKALSLRREGRTEEAEEELKKGRVLEQQLEEMEYAPKGPVSTKVEKKKLETVHKLDDDSETLDLGDNKVDSEVTDHDMNDPALLSVLRNLGWQDEDAEVVTATSKFAEKISDQSTYDSGPSSVPQRTRRSKTEMQRELLSIKRKALALRRQGKTEEAEEELTRAKFLEDQMAELEAPNDASYKEVESHNIGSLVPPEGSVIPATGHLLKSDVELPSSTINKSLKSAENPIKDVSNINSEKQTETKRIISSSSLHPEVAWIEPHSISKQDLPAEKSPMGQVYSSFQSDQSFNHVDSSFGSEQSSHRSNLDTYSHSPEKAFTQPEDQFDAKENTSSDNESFPHGLSISPIVGKNETAVTATSKLVTPEQGIDSCKDEILAHKRKAVALKREGKLAEAREELRQAKLLERSLEDGQQANEERRTTSTSTSDRVHVMQESKTNQAQKPMSGRDRLKLQQESLAHKRNALKLRREGKIQESEAELELAKALEDQLEGMNAQGSTATNMSKAEAGDVVVDDLLDPQLMSALKSIGWGDADFVTQPAKKSESKPSGSKAVNSSPEKGQLEEQIKSEKLRALNLKRAGNQAEALEALRMAKHLEKKLLSLSS